MGLAFNYGEFSIIKCGVMCGLTVAGELDGIAIPQPVGDEGFAVIGPEHVCELDMVLIISANDVDRGVGAFLFHAKPPIPSS